MWLWRRRHEPEAHTANAERRLRTVERQTKELRERVKRLEMDAQVYDARRRRELGMGG